jgi:hypothetical protein
VNKKLAPTYRAVLEVMARGYTLEVTEFGDRVFVALFHDAEGRPLPSEEEPKLTRATRDGLYHADLITPTGRERMTWTYSISAKGRAALQRPQFAKGDAVVWVFGDEARPGVVERVVRLDPSGFAYDIRRADGRRVGVNERDLRPAKEEAR